MTQLSSWGLGIYFSRPTAASLLSTAQSVNGQWEVAVEGVDSSMKRLTMCLMFLNLRPKQVLEECSIHKDGQSFHEKKEVAGHTLTWWNGHWCGQRGTMRIRTTDQRPMRAEEMTKIEECICLFDAEAPSLLSLRVEFNLHLCQALHFPNHRISWVFQFLIGKKSIGGRGSIVWASTHAWKG